MESRYISPPDRDELHDLYINKHWSTRKCAEHFGMSQPWLRKYLADYAIPLRSVKENGGYNKGQHLSITHRERIAKALKQNNGMRNKFFELHHGFKTGISSYRKYLTRGFLAPFCSNCNTKRHLVVHHIDKNRSNNSLSNLKVLCASCHKKHHLAHKDALSILRVL